MLTISHCSALNSHPLKTAERETTPPALYFVWDFVQRTKTILSGIDISKLVNKRDSRAIEAYWDCVGRASLINIIVHDDSGKTDEMLGGSRVDFGTEVLVCARAFDSPDNPFDF